MTLTSNFHGMNEGDEFAQARQQERQARWMAIACFVAVFASAVWMQ